MMLFAVLLLALTRAEIVERFRAPVVNQADGFIQVFANCPEDMRREYQTPVARCAAETVRILYGRNKPQRFRSPGIIVHLGDVRTNLAEVVTRVTTNAERVVTRIYLRAPGHADLGRFRTEVVKAFSRTIEKREIDDATAIARYRKADPAFRIPDERKRLTDWFDHGIGDDEEGLRRMTRIVEPGHASQREILFFASRLFLYSPAFDQLFLDRYHSLSFREAIAASKRDPNVRLRAIVKAPEMMVFGGGRGERMQQSAEAYMEFLTELAKGELSEVELEALLDAAEIKLNLALEEARKEGR